MDTVALPKTAGPKRALPRLTGRARLFVRAAHVIVAAGWLGLTVSMLVLGMSAAMSGEPALAGAAYGFMDGIGARVIPGFAIATLLTGIVLSVATPWGLIKHYWVIVKVVLTFAVIVTGIALTTRWLEQALIAAGEATTLTGAAQTGQTLGGSAGLLLVVGSVAHLLMLGAATVISVAKPWGKTRRGRRLAADRAQRLAADRARRRARHHVGTATARPRPYDADMDVLVASPTAQGSGP
jgi:hypothetical protein